MIDTPKTEAPPPRFLIKGQYVKDLSFESPHAPHSLMVLEEKPRTDISMDLRVQRLNDQHFEVTLHITARATGKNGTLFLVELDYAGIVQCIDVPEEKVEALLLVDCAFVLFPFARRVVADATRDGGFPPLMMEPVDFYTLYLQNKQR